MLFTQETGNSLILEWYLDQSLKDSESLSYISDYKSGLCSIVGYDNNTKQVNQVKIYSSRIEGINNSINRSNELDFKPSGFNEEEGNYNLDKFVDGQYPNSAIYLTKLAVDDLGYRNQSVILINHSDNGYVITAFEKNFKLVFHQSLTTERDDEAYYLIVSCSHHFFKNKPSVFIEAELDHFKNMEAFLGKYFEDVKHLYCSIKTLVPGLEANKIIDTNCILSTTYIKSVF
jgi:hypothetical protein